MSNSQKMTMEERLAQRLKDSELGTFFEDDDLTEIVSRAVERAFFKGREEGTSYNSKRLPPIIVEMAEETFRTAMKEYVNAAAAELVKKPEFQEMAAQYMLMALPQVLRDSVNGMVFQTVTNISYELEQRLKQEMSQTFANMAARPVGSY